MLHSSTGFELVSERTRKHDLHDAINLVPLRSEFLCVGHTAWRDRLPDFSVSPVCGIHLMQNMFSYSSHSIVEMLQDTLMYSVFAGLDAAITRRPGNLHLGGDPSVRRAQPHQRVRRRHQYHLIH